MDWITAINRALRYVEDHLTDEDLCVDAVAREAAYSPFYLQRLFYVLTDQTLADYIRQRRLSLAGQELQLRNAKVIDIALRYGYETPESFQKAFRRFHGITPSAAQHTRVQLRYRNPLQIHIELTGGSIMDYALENIGPLTVRGQKRMFRYDNGFEQIPKFWSEYYEKGLHKTVPGYIAVCQDDKGSTEFAYTIGCFSEPGDPTPDGFTRITLAPHLWAKFRAVGPIPESIQKVNRQIYTEWLPNNPEYELAEDVNIEMYTEGDMTSADYVSEIWLPVRART